MRRTHQDRRQQAWPPTPSCRTHRVATLAGRDADARAASSTHGVVVTRGRRGFHSDSDSYERWRAICEGDRARFVGGRSAAKSVHCGIHLSDVPGIPGGTGSEPPRSTGMFRRSRLRCQRPAWRPAAVAAVDAASASIRASARVTIPSAAQMRGVTSFVARVPDARAASRTHTGLVAADQQLRLRPGPG